MLLLIGLAFKKETLDFALLEMPPNTIDSLKAYMPKKNNIPEYLSPLNIQPTPKRDEYPRASFNSFTIIL
jgi:hypothetical protein